MSVSKASVPKHTQKPGKIPETRKILLSLNFSSFPGQDTFYFIRIDPNITQDMSQNANVAFNFLLDFSTDEDFQYVFADKALIQLFGDACLF